MNKRALLITFLLIAAVLLFGCSKPRKGVKNMDTDGFIFMAVPSQSNDYYEPFFEDVFSFHKQFNDKQIAGDKVVSLPYTETGYDDIWIRDVAPVATSRLVKFVYAPSYLPENIFYADLDTINAKGILVTGHGKGLVQKNSNINGKYIANDLVRLIIKNGQLFGYQGYVEKDDNELTKIEYLLYFFASDEPNQPKEPLNINVLKYLSLSKHNIDMGDSVRNCFSSHSQSMKSAYDEYSEILMQAQDGCFISIPFTVDENERASFVNSIIK